eukprot:TRINITY_DN13670_c0_g2_i1.p1 TRINITY_DN13670_c0_g2~~TRINITY_DN13670_c0_g2_i1.p1  ORF type:complete len:131 (+),score=33.80 TRINITY_DN13670_c0_g2_i1:66-458(+)
MPRVFAVLASLTVALSIKVDPLASAMISEITKDLPQSQNMASQADSEPVANVDEWIKRKTPAMQAGWKQAFQRLDNIKAIKAQQEAETAALDVEILHGDAARAEAETEYEDNLETNEEEEDEEMAAANLF